MQSSPWLSSYRLILRFRVPVDPLSPQRAGHTGTASPRAGSELPPLP